MPDTTTENSSLPRPAPDGSLRQLALLATVLLAGGLLYTWSVFAPPFAEHLTALTGSKVTEGELSIAFSFSLVGSPAGMFVSGMLIRRFGTRVALRMAAFMILAGFTCAALSTTPTTLTLSYGLLYGFGSGMTFNTAMSKAVSLFPKSRRGFASGVASMAFGLSSSIYAPVATILAATAGVVAAMIVLAAFAACVIAAISFFIAPDGKKVNAAAEGNTGANETPWNEMLKTTEFRLMWLFYMFGCMATLMLFSNCAAMASGQLGISLVEASLTVSLLSLASTLGRLAGGILSDRVGRVNTLLYSLAVLAAGLAAMIFSGPGDLALFSFGCMCAGSVFGAFNSVYPGYLADRFGSRELARNFCFINIACCVAAFLGPMLLRMTAVGNDYSVSYMAAMTTVAASLLAGLALKELERRGRWSGRRRTGSRSRSPGPRA